MSTATATPKSKAAPRQTTTAPGTLNEVTVSHVRLQLPPHVYDQYAEPAIAAGKDPEVAMAERLCNVASQRQPGIWFGPEEKVRLEKFLGRAIGTEASGVLQRLDAVRMIDVSGTKVELPMTTLKRLSTRMRRGQTLEQLIQEQTVKALRQFVGELPY
jgi:hypothetical protein